MSNKNIGLTRYKRPSGEEIKTTNSGIFKDPSKFIPQYSTNNMPKDPQKAFKPHVISRHASEEELRRKIPVHHNNSDHNLVSA